MADSGVDETMEHSHDNLLRDSEDKVEDKPESAEKDGVTVNGGAEASQGSTEEDSSEQEKQDNTQEDEAKKEKEAELGKYWKTVEDNPMDFTGWTYLLQYVEQESNPDNCRKAYEAFFSHYPYCYGYWKKYSDMEKRNGNKERAAEVFEKGLSAIPLSVELWLHYLNYYIAEYNSDPDSKDKIRKLYERALAAAGLEFRSDKLWDSYISWENQNANLKAVTAIYDRLISTPTQLYSHHWENYCRHINIHHPKDILDIDYFLKIRSEVLNKSWGYGAHDEDDVGLDEALQLGESNDTEAPPGMMPSIGDEKEVKKIRAKLIETKEVIFKGNEAEVGKRWTFEETIRRPYFHVKPLERGQLKNWREYLDFEIAQNVHNRIVVLFERSLIACALYEDFWMKYAKYLEQHSIDGVRSVYQRACDIHLPKKPYIHLAWAAFEERKENHSLARKILMNIENNVPGLAMVCMRRISLERRCGNHEAGEELFKKYIETAVSHKSRTFFCIKYARYLQKVMGETDKARKVLNDALEIDNTNEKVFLQLLDVEYQSQPIVEERVMETFNRLLTSEVSLEFKVKVSQRRMEFLEDFGTCIQKISFAYDEHQKLVKEASSKKKRPEREQAPEEPPDKRMKIEPPVNHNVPPSVEPVPAPPPMPPMGPPPPPDAGYAYNPWGGGGYPMAGGYPGYHYPSYPSQYGYYGY
ncbi:pre-mRNA-processing factor 39 isoform X2 [Aplysia californica]|uniref:Pre-mRNA-processing factor 39 isoform X2 n=1 Tax=Aplysia californica TaxID=6500 RepID=A0ABM0JVJ8_APLCA|nr:pre-mRNA-processing factor 39 isoform X2 [Aplysia californica]